MLIAFKRLFIIYSKKDRFDSRSTVAHLQTYRVIKLFLKNIIIYLQFNKGWKTDIAKYYSIMLK